ncbi:MAG TPA: hypothetical protein VKY65_13820 [Alphaproteobacteria bacterium]|nr:hypothetical protein [Alphaproteobacteria bacterium]
MMPTILTASNGYRAPRLGELLVAQGALSRGQLAEALAAQRRGRERIGETLLRLGLITRRQLAAALFEQYRYWMAGAFGLAFMALEPAAGIAGTTHAELQVSAEVVNAGTVDAQLAALSRGHGGTSANAAVSLSCSAAGVVRVSVESLGALGPARLVECGRAGEVVRTGLVGGAKTGGPHALNVTVEY